MTNPNTDDPTRKALSRTWRLGRRWLNVMIFAGLLLGAAWVLTLPPMGGSKEARHRAWCGSNLKLIHRAIREYAEVHDGNLPGSFWELIREQKIHPWDLICPSSGDKTGLSDTPQQWSESLLEGGHLSYIYLGAGLKNPDPVVVLAIERLSNHKMKFAHALFGDGRVRSLSPREARGILDQAANGARPVRGSFK